MHHVQFTLVCLIWGSSFMLMKIGLPVLGPAGVAAWRVSLGAMVAGLIWLTLRQPWPMRRRDLPGLLLIGVIGSVLPFVIQPYIIGVIDRHSGHGSSFAGMMVALVPLLTILASVPMLRVLPSPRQLVGVLVGLVAVMYLFADELRQGVAVGDLALASITPAMYAVSNTFIKRRFARAPTMALLLCKLGIASACLWPVSLALGPIAPDASAPAVRAAVAAMLVLGVLGTGLAEFMFYRLVQRQGPLFAGMVTYVIPCLAMVIGHFRDEPISRAQVASLAVVLAMVAWVQTGRPRTLVSPPATNNPPAGAEGLRKDSR